MSCLPSQGLLTSCLPSQGLLPSCLPSQGLLSSCLPSQGLLSSCLPSQGLLSSCLPSQGLLSSCLPSQGLLSSYLPSQGLFSSCLPCLSPRPRWPPRLQMHLFGQDWLLVCWTHHWCRCDQLASPGPQHCPLRPRSLQSPLQRPLRLRSSQSPLQRPLCFRSSQSPAFQGPRRSRPALQSPCWSRPSLQSPCWSRPAHLRLRWSRPAQLRLRWSPSRLWSSPRKLFWGGHLPTDPRSPQIHQGRPSPLIHHGCPRPRIYYGPLENSLPWSLRLYVLSLSLVFQFPLGPSFCRGSQLRSGGRLSRLLRPGGHLSRLLRPGGRLSRLLRPGGRLSRLLHPGGRLTCQSHFTSPLTCQSHFTSPLTCQSPFTSPLTCQNLKWRTQQLSCQQSLLSRPPHPGGLLSHLPHMDLAPHSLPRFHLRSTALLDCSMCEASGSRSLGGGLCHESGCHSPHLLHHTTAAHHPRTAFPIHHCTNHTAVTNHSFALIVSPHLHLIHTHTHTHISSTLPCTHCEVLFSPVWHFQAFSLSVFTCTAYTTLAVCCLPFDPACRLISSLPAACPDLCIAPVADSALPSLHLILSLNLACLTSSCLSIKLYLVLTTLPLH